MQPAVVKRQSPPPPGVVCQEVIRLQPDGSAIRCQFADASTLTLSRFLAGFVRPSDQLEFDPTAADPSRETRVLQQSARRPRDLYSAPIAYVTQPRSDKRGECFVRAEVAGAR